MRRMLIPLAVGVGIGVFVASFLGYFLVAKQGTYWVDGLGRPLFSAPWPARLVFGANKEWAGWSWFFVDLLWFWGGLGLAFFLGSLAGKHPTESKLPKALITILGIVIAISTAYVTHRVIKTGVAFALEAGLGAKPRLVVCAATAGTKANLPLVEYRQWSRYTDREQDIYVQGLLETWSMALYNMTDPKQPSAEFSAFTTCVEKEARSDFNMTHLINLTYNLLGQIGQPPVVHLFDNTPNRCGKYATKGDGSLRPVRLIRKEDWTRFNDRERMIYLMGYVDFVNFSDQRILTLSSKEQSTLDQTALRLLEKKKEQLQCLEVCLGQTGIEGVFKTMSNQQIEWEYPLPWSVATALGDTCFSRGRSGKQ